MNCYINERSNCWLINISVQSNGSHESTDRPFVPSWDQCFAAHAEQAQAPRLYPQEVYP